MTKSDYLKAADKWEIDSDLVVEIGKLYTTKLPKQLKRILSHAREPFFFDDGSHILSFDEVRWAEDDLGVAFSEMNLIPVVDCCDGDYIVYNYKNKMWAKYNISDDILFKEGKTLGDLL